MSIIIDSHCHLDQLNLTEFDGELQKVLDHAKDNQVGYFLCVCIDMNNFPAVLAIAREHPNISASVGVHPNEQDSDDPSEEELIELAQDDEIVAIGETGLDYFRTQSDVKWQQDRFRRHIRAAIATKKPLIVHTRNAREDTIQILREENAHQIGGVLHCFTESLEMAQAAIEMNFYISFSGIVTFKNSTELQQVAKVLPLDRILIETDSPYLAPMPYRGKPNYPGHVIFVAKKIAELRGIDFEQVATATTQNFFNAFPLTREKFDNLS